MSDKRSDPESPSDPILQRMAERRSEQAESETLLGGLSNWKSADGAQRAGSFLLSLACWVIAGLILPYRLGAWAVAKVRNVDYRLLVGRLIFGRVTAYSLVLAGRQDLDRQLILTVGRLGKIRLLRTGVDIQETAKIRFRRKRRGEQTLFLLRDSFGNRLLLPPAAVLRLLGKHENGVACLTELFLRAEILARATGGHASPVENSHAKESDTKWENQVRVDLFFHGGIRLLRLADKCGNRLVLPDASVPSLLALHEKGSVDIAGLVCLATALAGGRLQEVRTDLVLLKRRRRTSSQATPVR